MIKKLLGYFCLLVFVASCNNEQKRQNVYKNYSSITSEAYQYAKKNNLSTDFFILVDLSLPSGKDRMLVWDFGKNQAEYSFLAMHGSGRNRKDPKVRYSNEPKSFLSSKGKYILAKEKSYSNNFGYKYLMYGQDSTNSNALRRKIVLHHSNYVPGKEVFPKRIGMSRGCPAVSKGAFKILDEKIQSTNKRVLLWII